jgi:hypothetical protein
MEMKTYWLTAASLLFAQELQSVPDTYTAEITKKILQTHVRYLSADLLEGRLTGSEGEKLATQYVSNLFAQAGLEPVGDNGTFFQEFNFVTGVTEGKNNSLSLTNQQGVTKIPLLNQEWRPLGFSDSGLIEEKELIFAGYGITAPASKNLAVYDSYKGLNVKNKWVIVFPSLPAQSSDSVRRQLNTYSTLRYKAFTAKNHGAKGIIFVNSTLLPLSSNTSLSGSGIQVLSVKNEIIDSLLSANSPPFNSLKKLQGILDADHLTTLPKLKHIKIQGQIDLKQKIQRGRNVLARLRLTSESGSLLIVGAHVDHLGRGQLGGSRQGKGEEGMIHPGADDNASGVASVLAVASQLSHLKKQGLLQGNKNIVFAAWSGEEYGVLGSSHFVEQLMKHETSKSLRPAIDATINLDMIGHLREHLVIQGVGSSTNWPNIIKQLRAKYPTPIITQTDPYLPTDSTAFYVQGVPTLNLFTGAHDSYHTPRDTADTLNYEGIKNISQIVLGLIHLLEEQKELTRYQKVPRKRDTVEREFKIYLGTIPDYATADVSGVKLSGVTKNSPAEQAGLRHADVIIELAGKKIHDIYDYTYILNSLPVGKPLPLIVRRGQEQLSLIITAQYRK